MGADKSVLVRNNSSKSSLLQSLDGKVNAVVMSTGTGGTLAGVSMYLKEKNKNIRTVLADPPVCRLIDH